MFYYFSQHLAFNTYKIRKYSNTEDIRIISVNNCIFEFMDDIFYCNYDIFCNKTEFLLCESLCNGIGFVGIFAGSGLPFGGSEGRNAHREAHGEAIPLNFLLRKSVTTCCHMQ